MATNIGTGPQDIPLNQFLGEMAFMDAKPKVACKVSLSSVGNHNLTAGQYFPFTNVIWQYGVEFDTSVYAFYAPYPGIYSVNMNTYKNGTGAPTTFEIMKNSTTVICTSRGTNSGDITQHASILEYLDVGDTIAVRAGSAFVAYEDTTFGKYTSLNIHYIG